MYGYLLEIFIFRLNNNKEFITVSISYTEMVF